MLVACVIGDGEAETGPPAAAWHSNKFLGPVRDGAVLPILHLNGYKIADLTVLARLPEPELDDLLRDFGHQPLHVTGDDSLAVPLRWRSRWMPPSTTSPPHRGPAVRGSGAVRPSLPLLSPSDR
ncbi:hypothetical protein M878_44590 [Streptomyces roseochromogenus subsp. oscitans DS 12.976]|uniref:Xylulose 5-phosphate/Fructose 6-phosphate phosphoketolase N-terminal domain-containing protein n=1 Tax=Streptomyces roseochromogenus subsp. oscitans DS 12.976 TaxID=1352936 RepID=V6JFW8_STRRC|nr:hypothetical protein M878_44590 [Streptomyces roseochromogenus subsp. oscitans DS 12.976]